MWARAAGHARKKVWFSICVERRGKGQISALQKMSPPGAFNTAPEAQFVVGLPIPPSRLRRATVPQFNMVASLRAQSALAMFPVSLGLLRPVSATGGGLRTPLFPSGKRRLLDGAASCDSSTSQKAPFSQKGSCRRQPTEGFPPSLSAKLTEGLSPFAISKAHWHCPCIKSHFPRLKLFHPFLGI